MIGIGLNLSESVTAMFYEQSGPFGFFCQFIETNCLIFNFTQYFLQLIECRFVGI